MATTQQDKYIDHVWLKDGHLIVLTPEKLHVFHRSTETGAPPVPVPAPGIAGDFLRAETIVALSKGTDYGACFLLGQRYIDSDKGAGAKLYC